MQVKTQQGRDWGRRAAGKTTSRSTRGAVPRLQAFTLWQAGSSQHFPIKILACISIGSAGLTGGQSCLKMEKASDCQEVARFIMSLLADPPCHPKPLLHTSPRLMHDQLNRGSTARCCAMMCCQEASIARKAMFSLTGRRDLNTCDGNLRNNALVQQQSSFVHAQSQAPYLRPQL